MALVRNPLQLAGVGALSDGVGEREWKSADTAVRHLDPHSKYHHSHWRVLRAVDLDPETKEQIVTHHISLNMPSCIAAVLMHCLSV
jgi:hypothetical protein